MRVARFIVAFFTFACGASTSGGIPEDCEVRVDGVCHMTQAEACDAASCPLERCTLLDSYPAQVECRPGESRAAREVTFAEAVDVPGEQLIAFDAWLWAAPAECAPCPEDEDVSCEACLPDHYNVGGAPEHTHGATVIEVEPDEGLHALSVGQKIRLTGEWMGEPSPHSLRYFTTYEVTVLQ